MIRRERDVNAWNDRLLTVEAARPSTCLACGAAAQKPGCRLGIHGHGLRRRDIWGPIAFGEKPEIFTVILRRFRCLSCRAIFTVGPNALIPHRRYGAGAIALAIALWAVFGQSASAVRKRISPNPLTGPDAPHRWRTLDRWVDAIGAGRLFQDLRLSSDTPTHRRALAECFAARVMGLLPNAKLGPVTEAGVFAGAVQIA